MPASLAMFLIAGAIKHLVPADGAVRLRDQAYQVRVTDQAAEGGNGNVACAHEDDAHVKACPDGLRRSMLNPDSGGE